MTRDRRQVEAGLKNKGFQESMKHHRYFIYYDCRGKKTRVKTHTSHSPKHKNLGDELLAQMAKQCALTKAQFLDLVDCPLGRKEYEEILAKRGEVL